MVDTRRSWIQGGGYFTNDVNALKTASWLQKNFLKNPTADLHK